MSTTVWASWEQVDHTSLTIAEFIRRALTYFVADYDLAAIEADYRAAINEALPEGVSLHGEEFYGPHPQPENADEQIQAAVSSLDTDVFWEIVAKHEITPDSPRLMDAETAEPIGPATEEQIEASFAAGDTGIILIDADGDVVAEQDANQPYTPQPVRRVYVEG